MAKFSFVKGTTSKIQHIVIYDSSSSVGAGLTGLVFNSAGLTAYYIRPGDASPTAITLATATVGTWATGGFKEVSSANMPGTYELDIPDACLATGATHVTIMLKGATNMAPCSLEIELTAVNNQSATAFITGVNSLAPPANWNTDVVQSGDAYSRIGAAGAGLTAIGDTRLSNLDAAISTRSTYTGSDTSGTTTLLGRLTSTRAGLLDNLDATVSSRLASASYTAPSNASIASIKAITDQFVFTIANQVDANALTGGGGLSAAGTRAALGMASANLDTQLAALPTAAANADKILGRNIEAGADGTRTVGEALGFLRNKWTVAGTTLTVYKDDGTTTWWTGTVSTSAGADPIVGNAPA